MDQHTTIRQSSPEAATAAIALAGVRQFVSQPLHAQTSELLCLVRAFGPLSDIRIVGSDGGTAIMGFAVSNDRGNVHFTCNGASFAYILTIAVCGQSLFVNFTGSTPYFKACGRRQKKAGFIVSRPIAGAEAVDDGEGGKEDIKGESVKFLNGDTTDLTYQNVRIQAGRPRRDISTGTLHFLEEVLAHSNEAPDELFAGEPADKWNAAKALLSAVIERMTEEREAVLSREQTAVA